MRRRKGVILRAGESWVVWSAWRKELVRERGIKDAKGGEMSRRTDGDSVPGGEVGLPRGEEQRGRAACAGERS